MSKKLVIAVAVVGLIIGVLVGVVLVYSGKKSEKGSATDNAFDTGLVKTIVGDAVKGDLVYKDEAGFSFSYPKGINVKDVTPDDGVYYSQMTLNKDGKFITVSVLDTKESGVDVYVKKDAVLKDALLYGATKLGEMSAKQYSTAAVLYTLSIDQGILYLIEGPKDGGFWEKVHGVVVDSFALNSSNAQSGSGGSDGVIYEEEEVVE